MIAEHRNAPARRGGGASEGVELATADSSEDNTTALQVQYLAQRYGLTRPHARVVAEQHFGGAGGGHA
mgnify:CR=1 FL=1